MSVEADCRRLLDAARALIEAGVEDSDPLARAIRATTVGAPRLAPRRLAACRHWQPALALADDAIAAIAGLLAPLAALYLWWGDIATPARLVPRQEKS